MNDFVMKNIYPDDTFDAFQSRVVCDFGHGLVGKYVGVDGVMNLDSDDAIEKVYQIGRAKEVKVYLHENPMESE